MILLLFAGAVAFDSTLHHAHQSFLTTMDFKHHLRVCNAYPYEGGLDIIRVEERLTELPMDYKECRDFKVQLKSGDRLDFKIDNSNAGTFAIDELPQNDAVLMLVIHRHDTVTTTSAFESHIFAIRLNAQITTIDAYKGSATGGLKIQDKADAKNSRSEELRYNSVVAVNPGAYNIVLVEDGKPKDTESLVALNRESYIVLRVGLEAEEGKKYPPEIVVFPKSDPSLIGASSVVSSMSTLLFMMALAL